MTTTKTNSVFIVDDEIYIVEMLKAIIDWNKYNLKCCSTAYDGLLAFEKIMLLKPDIVITDIRLPGMSGLELIEKCMHEGIGSKFIVISGYSQFELAQTAMKYGVREYILKPIKQEEIEGALLRTKMQIESEEQQASDSVQPEKHAAKKYKILNNGFLLDFKRKKINLSTIEKINNRYSFSMKPGLFQLLCLKLDYLDAASTAQKGEHDEEVRDAIVQQAIHSIEGYCHEIIAEVQPLTCNVIINYSQANAHQIASELAYCMERISGSLKQQGSYRVTLTKAIAVNDLFEIRNQFEAFESVFVQRICEPAKLVLEMKDCEQNSGREVMLTLEDYHLIKSTVRNSDVNELRECLNMVMAVYMLKCEENANALWSICYQIQTAALNELSQLMQRDQTIRYSENEFELGERLKHCATTKVLRNAFVDCMIEQMESYINQTSKDGNDTIYRIDKYIMEHYERKIMLKDLADVAHMNTCYLGVYFKRHMGVSVVDYINSFRIEKAKELLRTTDESILAISEMVGFADPKYFAKVFRKLTHVNPSYFRKGKES